MRIYIHAALYWPLLFGLAAINGSVREWLLAPPLGALARPVSGLTLIALLAIAIAFFVVWHAGITAPQAWLIGGSWLAATLVAETLLARAAGKPASDVAMDFTWSALRSGNWVALAFVFVLVAPALFVRLRGE
jgi:hypothetical protein